MTEVVRSRHHAAGLEKGVCVFVCLFFKLVNERMLCKDIQAPWVDRV